MNAGGVPNTCKSSEGLLGIEYSISVFSFLTLVVGLEETKHALLSAGYALLSVSKIEY